MVAEIVVPHSTLLCVADALTVVNGTDDWLIIWATILVGVAIWLERIALEFFFKDAQAHVLIEGLEWVASPDILNTKACVWISLTLAGLGVIGAWLMVVRT